MYGKRKKLNRFKNQDSSSCHTRLDGKDLAWMTNEERVVVEVENSGLLKVLWEEMRPVGEAPMAESQIHMIVLVVAASVAPKEPGKSRDSHWFCDEDWVEAIHSSP